jgi:hypothetical protein
MNPRREHQDLHHPAAHVGQEVLHQRPRGSRFGLLAPQHPHADHHEAFSRRVAVQQKHGLIAASPTAAVALGLGHLLLLFLAHRMVVLVEQQPQRALVVLVVGHEEVRAVGQEDPFLVVGLQFRVQRGHVAVVPLLQFLRLGVAGQFAQLVLVAGSLTRKEVAFVEALALELQVSGFWLDVALGHRGPQGVDQAARADDPGIGVEAVRAVEP